MPVREKDKNKITTRMRKGGREEKKMIAAEYISIFI
jgi:hypothetical protein